MLKTAHDAIDDLCGELLRTVPGAREASLESGGAPYEGWVEIGEPGVDERGVGFTVNPDGSIRMFKHFPDPSDPHDWSDDHDLTDGAAAELLPVARTFLTDTTTATA